MTEESLKRKLAAILSADVVGYSRLMRDDEESTIRTLTDYRSAMTSLIQEHRGRVVDAPGDNLLAEFSSAVHAVTGAVEIQRELAERNAELSDEHKMHFRIGVNVGDVVEDEDRIYGDGVNIAARIQAAADSDSVFVSQTLFDQVKRHSSYRFEDLGLHSLKNISEPIRIYKVIGGMSTYRFLNKPSKKHVTAKGIRAASIAVLPFEVTGGDDDQQYFADGLTEDIIVELARFKKLFVSSRSASFAYDTHGIDPLQVGRELGVKHILEGQVRRLGRRVRISVHLINVQSGEHLWAERFDRQFDDLFDILDELVGRIVGTIAGRVEAAGMAEARRKRPEDRTAYDYLLRGLEYHRLGGVTLDNLREAVKWYDRAIAADPNYGAAYAWRVCAISGLPGFDYAEGIKLTQKAIELDENDAEAHRIMGSCQMSCGDFAAAEYHHLRAMELNPSDAFIKARSAAFYTFKGEPNRALELIEEAVAQDPYLPVWCIEERGVALFALQRFKEALAALAAMPFQTYRSRCYEAACRMSMDDKAGAREAVTKALLSHPTLTASEFFHQEVYKDKEQVRNLQNLLSAAGLPKIANVSP
ncbi:MAG: adenylate/guanylate cyclase domain-containing protein [Desulfobacterales bacterium]